MRALAILVVVGGSACNAPAPFASGRCSASSAPVAPWSGWGLAGQPTTVRIRHGAVCLPEVEVSATVAVVDPLGNELALESNIDVTDRSEDEMSVSIEVTPALAGPHYVTARFEPNLGLEQFILPVGFDHSGQAPVWDVPLSRIDHCTHVDITELGRMVCLAPFVAIFEPDGGLLVELTDAGTAARSREVLWVQTTREGIVARYVETDAGFPSTRLNVVAGAGAQLMPASEDVMVINTPTVLRARASGDSVEWAGMAETARRPIAGAWRDTDRLLLTNAVSTCAFTFLIPQSCTPQAGLLLSPVAAGSGSQGVWLHFAGGFLGTRELQPGLQLLHPDRPGTLLLSDHLCTGCSDDWVVSQHGLEWDSAPTIRRPSDPGRWYVPTLRDGVWVPDVWNVANVTNVSERWVVSCVPDAGCRIYSR